RDVEDPLARAGEAEGILCVLDVPGFVEAVDEAAGQVGVRGGPVGAADAEMAVAQAEERLEGSGVSGKVDGLHELPGIVRETGAVRGDECHGCWGSFWRCAGSGGGL